MANAAVGELKAQARSGVGKGAARALRREGLIPAVIYGDKQPPLSISIAYNDANKRIYAGGFLSHVITIDVDGTVARVEAALHGSRPRRSFLPEAPLAEAPLAGATVSDL